MGNSLFAESNRQTNDRIEGLYAGLRQPALKRYGETTSRTDEVIAGADPPKAEG